MQISRCKLYGHLLLCVQAAFRKLQQPDEGLPPEPQTEEAQNQVEAQTRQTQQKPPTPRQALACRDLA